MKRIAILATMAALQSVSAGAAQETPKPQILILTTGGTIASRVGASMRDGASLIEAVPELAQYADITVEEFSRIGSSQMTPAHWMRLANRINQAFSQAPDLTGVVVTHGTDTLDDTAFFLNLTVRDTRPVVVVGAMRSANEISADGPANIINAVRVASHEQAIGMGVLVVLNEDIAAARDVWKTDNRRVNTFRSPEVGFLGFADPDEVGFYRIPMRAHTSQSEFDLTGIDSLPRVEIVTDYAGSDGSLLDHVVGTRPAGVVVATFAGGRTSPETRGAIERAVEAGIPLVIASRVPGGRIVGDVLGDVEGIVARDLPPHKARILLMLALTLSRSIDEIQRMFDTY